MISVLTLLSFTSFVFFFYLITFFFQVRTYAEEISQPPTLREATLCLKKGGFRSSLLEKGGRGD